MEWMEYEGRKVFLRLRNGRVYSGKVISVDDSAKPLIFLTINDKFNRHVTFAISEIVEIKEEEE